MFTFFDYLYYKTCAFYLKYGEKDPAFTGVCVVSIMQGLNILSKYGPEKFFFDYNNVKSNDNKPH